MGNAAAADVIVADHRAAWSGLGGAGALVS